MRSNYTDYFNFGNLTTTVCQARDSIGRRARHKGKSGTERDVVRGSARKGKGGGYPSRRRAGNDSERSSNNGCQGVTCSVSISDNYERDSGGRTIRAAPSSAYLVGYPTVSHCGRCKVTTSLVCSLCTLLSRAKLYGHVVSDALAVDQAQCEVMW
jgi:hypothetical protein